MISLPNRQAAILLGVIFICSGLVAVLPVEVVKTVEVERILRIRHNFVIFLC